MPRTLRIGRVHAPPQNGQLRIAALDDPPPLGLVGHGSANFTTVFLERSHKDCVPSEYRIHREPDVDVGIIACYGIHAKAINWSEDGELIA